MPAKNGDSVLRISCSMFYHSMARDFGIARTLPYSLGAAGWIREITQAHTHIYTHTGPYTHTNTYTQAHTHTNT